MAIGDEAAWKGYEYAALFGGSSADELAELLGRDPEQVKRKVRAEAETTFDDWYRHNRCPGSPAGPERLLGLARVICERGYPRLAEGGRDWLMCEVFRALAVAFDTFDAKKGNPERPGEERFSQYFRRILVLQLWNAERRRCRRAKARRQLRQCPPPARWQPEGNELLDFWQRLLLKLALGRLDPRTRRCVQMRLAERRNDAIAAVLGIPVRQVSRDFSWPKLRARIRDAIRALIGALAESERRRLVAHLVSGGELEDDDVERLLRTPADILVIDIRAARRGLIDAPTREQAVALVEAAALVGAAAG